jgi:hypothetical protein
MEQLPFREGGSLVDVSDADVIVLVGPNNCGKTRTLQEIATRLAEQPGSVPSPGNLVILDDIEIQQQLDAEELLNWLKTNRYTFRAGRNLMIRVTPGGDLYESQVAGWWSNPPGIGGLQNQLVKGLLAGECLSYLGSPQRLDPSKLGEVWSRPDSP